MHVIIFLNVLFSTPGYFCNTLFFHSETNQELVMTQGGISLLSLTADNAEDPQTLRMVAGAIANLCGNGIFLANMFLLCLLVIESLFL